MGPAWVAINETSTNEPQLAGVRVVDGMCHPVHAQAMKRCALYPFWMYTLLPVP
jgi:hypothetical protein